MLGTELILMSLMAAMQNGTIFKDGAPPEIDGNLDINKHDVSLATVNLMYRNNTIPTELKITSWQNMPYSGLVCKNGTCRGEGYAFDLFHYVQSKMNFTYTIVPPERSTIGTNTTGMMGLLYNQKVDLAVAYIPMLDDLNALCTFSYVVDEVKISFVMKRPSESATGAGILAPFNDTVWFYILISLIVVGPVIYIIVSIRTRMTSEGNPEGFSLLTCIWFAYGGLVKQGTTAEPVTNSTRVLFATWWIFIMILTSFYTANLTAFLTLSEFTLPFNNMDDVVNKHQRWIVLEDQMIPDILKREDSGTLQPLKRGMEDGSFVPREEDFHALLEWLERGRIFIGERHFIAKIISDDYDERTRSGVPENRRCTYAMLPNDIYVINRAFAFAKPSPLQEAIDTHLRHLVEGGVVAHLPNMDLRSVDICPLNLKSTERRLRNADLKLTYSLVAVGLIISSIAFGLEHLYRWLRYRSCICCAPITTSELPIHSTDSCPEYLNQYSPSAFENLHRQNKVGRGFINGREYWVVTEKAGDQRLVPIRTPSALLFPHAEE